MSARRCERCGESAPEHGLGWSSAVDGDTERWLCPSCTRAHARDIEGKLDERWWQDDG